MNNSKTNPNGEECRPASSCSPDCSHCEAFRQKAIAEATRSGDLLSENRKLRQELENIANASMKKWEMNSDEFLSEFQAWAQNRARHAISSANSPDEKSIENLAVFEKLTELERLRRSGISTLYRASLLLAIQCKPGIKTGELARLVNTEGASLSPAIKCLNDLGLIVAENVNGGIAIAQGSSLKYRTTREGERLAKGGQA